MFCNFYDATIAAASAIAAVGEKARIQREEELKIREINRQIIGNNGLYRATCEDDSRESRRRSAASRKSYY